MKKKILSLLLIITLLSGTCAHAVPIGLWEYDSRFENIFTVERSVSGEFDMLQKLIDYLGIAAKEDINGDDSVKSSVMLKALAEVAGIPYGEDVQASTILADLKAAKILKSTAKTALLSMQDILYAAARITGWVEDGATDSTVYAKAKQAGLLRNITYSSNRNLTKSETAQMIYNMLSVYIKVPETYNGSSKIFNNKPEAPILETRYGIVLKEGIVTSVFGESIFNQNSLDEDEIEIDGKVYNFNTDVSREGLVGRHTAFFVHKEDNLVLLIEPTTENTIYNIKFGSEFDFKPNIVEFNLDTDEDEFEVGSETIVVYNGMAVGTYSVNLINRYFTSGSELTAIDNDKDDVSDVILIRKWDTYIAAFEVGSEGTVIFDYDMTFEGNNYIDLTPDSKNVHITLLKNGEPADYKTIKAGDLISVSASVNATRNRYIIVELASQSVTGVLGMASDNKYYIDDAEYPVSELLINAQNTNPEVSAPVLGKSYTFYLDVSGQIANVSVPKEYIFGYLVKLSLSRAALDPKGLVKIFNADGKMIEMPIAKKVKLHTYAQTFVYEDDSEFVNKIIDEAKVRAGGDALYTGDYRSVVQYKANGKGELEELWLPYDNTSATEYGKTGYQLTYDVVESGNRTYYGVLWGNGMFRFPPSSPIFKVPGDIDAKDVMYSITNINQTQYNDTLEQGIALYSVDEYRIAGAGVIKGESSGEGDIGSYSSFVIVDKISQSVNQEKEVITKVYGWAGGKAVSYFTTEDDLTSDADTGWEVVKLSDLQFGDIIQFYEFNGDIRRFRVVYRASNPGADRIQVAVAGSTNESLSDGQTVEYGKIQQLVMSTGSYVSRKLNVLKVMQNGVENNFFLYSNRTPVVYIIDVGAKRVSISSLSELRKGDKVMLRGTWAAVDDVYVVR